MEYQGAIKEMEKGITRLRKQLDEAKSGTKTSQKGSFITVFRLTRGNQRG